MNNFNNFNDKWTICWYDFDFVGLDCMCRKHGTRFYIYEKDVSPQLTSLDTALNPQLSDSVSRFMSVLADDLCLLQRKVYNNIHMNEKKMIHILDLYESFAKTHDLLFEKDNIICWLAKHVVKIHFIDIDKMQKTVEKASDVDGALPKRVYKMLKTFP